MKGEERIKGLSIKVGPLGENDRLLTLLTYQEGIIRVAVPGARRPKSNLAAAAALTFLELQISGTTSLKRIRQMKVLKSFSKLGEQIESLAAAQVMTELCLLIVGMNDPQPKILETILFHLDRLEKRRVDPCFTLGNCIQSCVHLLVLGGYSIPLNNCCLSGMPLDPPIGNWNWLCSFLPTEGFAIGSIPDSKIKLNASELALLQRLIKPNLPIKKDGELMGPIDVWIKLLAIIDEWIEIHLNKSLSSLKILRQTYKEYIL